MLHSNASSKKISDAFMQEDDLRKPLQFYVGYQRGNCLLLSATRSRF